MPEAALPIPGPSTRGLEQMRLEFYDLLHRPMKGTLTVQRIDSGVPPVKVSVDGVLEMMVPPGGYRVLGTLWTVDEEQAAIEQIVEVEE